MEVGGEMIGGGGWMLDCWSSRCASGNVFGGIGGGRDDGVCVLVE